MIGHVIFKVIGHCNLDCPYCYYMTDLMGKWKTRFPIHGLDAFYKKYSEYSDQLKISWHGGEPLLIGMEFFNRAVSLPKKYGINVRHSIQSNGLLLNGEWADFFSENEFHVGISIDGKPTHHNLMRPAKSDNKYSSYEGAVQAIDILREKGIKFGTLSVISPDIKGKDVFDHLLSLGVKSMDFLLPISGNSLSREHVSGCANYLKSIFDAWIERDDPQIKIRYFQNIMRAISGISPRQCILGNSCSKYMTIEPNGDVGLCENIREIGVNHYQIGMNIFNNSFKSIEARISRKITSILFNSLGKECANCNYMRVCKGGCPVTRHSGDLSFKGPSEYCNLYKCIIQHIYEHMLAESIGIFQPSQIQDLRALQDNAYAAL